MRLSHVFRKTSLYSLSALLAVGGATTLPVQAEEELEEVVVTGSYIRRSSFEGAHNLQVLGAEQIKLTGATQVEELVNEFSVNSGSEAGAEDESGQAQFNIRNLGLGSTLTLINGRRAGVSTLAGPGGTEFYNVNQLPVNMIERIEVLADGASALYGSQAVAGVANIITRKGFEGLEITAGYSDALVDTREIGLALGSALADGRGHINVYTSYLDRPHIWRTDVDYIKAYIAPTPETSRFLSTRGSPGQYRQPGGSYVRDPDCEAAGGVRRSETDSFCRFDFSDQRSFMAGEERYSAFVEFDYEINDRMKLYSELSFSNTRMTNSLGGERYLVADGTSNTVPIPASHPFNFFVQDPANPTGIIYVPPSQWDNAVHTAVDLEALMRPLGSEATHNGDYLGHTEYNNNRVMMGLEVALTDTWMLDMSYGYSRSNRARAMPNNFRTDEFQRLVANGQWNPFGTAKATPDLVSPKNGLSIAGNSQIIQDRFDSHFSSQIKSAQQVFDAVATGDLIEMNGQMVQAAVGIQVRDTEYVRLDDPLDTALEGSLNRFIENFNFGGQNVESIFAEVYVPVGDTVDLQLAVRYEDYSIEDTVDPKISVDWRAADWLGFRASWGTSFQAPNIQQTTRSAGGQQINDSARLDPATGQVVCITDGSTGVQIGATQFLEGSSDLKPQSSENYNVGVVFTLANGLNASLDVWEFDYEDLIAPPLSAQAQVDNDCADDGIVNDPNILRSGEGQINAIFSQFVNIGRVTASGYDINFNYETGLGAGDLSVRGGFTYVDSFEIDNEDGSPIVDGAGSRNARNNFRTMPQLRGNANATYRWGVNTVTLGFNYIDDYLNDQSRNAVIDSMETFDIQYSRSFSDLLIPGDSTLTIGVNNFTDEDPPALVRNGADGNRLPHLNPSAGGFQATGIDRPGIDDFAGHSLMGRIAYVRWAYTL